MIVSFYIKYFRPIYRAIIPKKTRKKIELFLFGVSKPKLRKKIIKYLKNIPEKQISEEQKEVLEFLLKNPLQVFPYDFTKKYHNRCNVYHDNYTGLHFVLFEGKKLYFKRSWTVERIQTIFNNLLIEQDDKSPHRYLDDDFSVNKNDTIIDIGVADGNFTLSLIERIKKAYLFESDPEWIEALNATFEPWKEKVQIINKWVSNIDDDTYVTIDNYFKNIKIDFIKIDVDGFERKLLQGCENILNTYSKLKLAICTYHNQDDAKEFNDYLVKKRFNTSFSHGYMIFYWGKIKPPYIRRGLIRASKT